MINRILAADAATCAVMGLVLTAATPALATLLALPEPLLFTAGAALIPIALFMAALARQARPWAAGVALAVAGNLGWVAASAAVFAFVTPNLLGTAFIVLQAGVVALFAAAEFKARARSIGATA